MLFNPLMGTLKPHSNGPLYSNTMIGTLAIDGWAVIFGTARRVWAGRPRPQPPCCTKCNSPPINSRPSVPTSYYSVWHSKGLNFTFAVTLVHSSWVNDSTTTISDKPSSLGGVRRHAFRYSLMWCRRRYMTAERRPASTRIQIDTNVIAAQNTPLDISVPTSASQHATQHSSAIMSEIK